MGTNYHSFEEIKKDLKRLDFERQIALEVSESLKPYNWMETASKAIRKYGVLIILKKLFKKVGYRYIVRVLFHHVF